MNVTADGELELWLNPEGRDVLVRQLQALSIARDHFHLGSWEGAEIELKTQPHRPTDTILHAGKVMFRADEWD
jgi:hypothetical protein